VGVAAFAVIVGVAGAGRRCAPRAATPDVARMGLSGCCDQLGMFVARRDRAVLDASLGYFINPLLSVALGTLVLREWLRWLQWLAIGAAVIGVRS
jgi:drug/metabolite transporter (DMT)-like permease